MLYGLSDETVSKIKSVFSNFAQVEQVIIYGSRAMGNYRNGSDIDLTLVGKDLNVSIMNKLDAKLDDLMLPYTFDISMLMQISNKDLLEHIERVGVDFMRQYK